MELTHKFYDLWQICMRLSCESPITVRRHVSILNFSHFYSNTLAPDAIVKLSRTHESNGRHLVGSTVYRSLSSLPRESILE